MAEVNADGTVKEEGASIPKDDEPIEILDPGQEEGNKVKSYNDIPEQSKRGKEIYWKAKEYDRKEEEFKAMGDMKETMATMSQHNKDLVAAMTRSAKATEAQVASAAGNPEQDAVDRIDEDLAKLQEDKKFALKDNNAEAVVEIDTKILALTGDKANAETTLKNKPVPISDDAKIVQGIALATPWLNPSDDKYDVVMEASAIALDKSLKTSVPDVKERMTKVTEEIERRFSYNKEEVKPAVNISGVFSAQPASIKVGGDSSAGEIELTEAQIKAAPHMFSEEADPIQAMKNQLRLMGA
jgi:hypothetical protein